MIELLVHFLIGFIAGFVIGISLHPVSRGDPEQ
jgi:hypothetical protein